MDERQHKLQILARIAEKLNEEGVVWCVGASLLLYLHGRVDDFHDIDIMVKECDADRVELILSQFGRLQPQNNAVQYKTKQFLEYEIDGVDVDVMAGFAIVCDGVEYDCSLLEEQIEGTAVVDSQDIPLHAIGLWKRYYQLMGRTSKVEILRDINEG